MTADEIKLKWETDNLLYKELGEVVSNHLKNGLPNYELMPEISFRTKELISIIKKIQRKSKDKKYTYDDLKDKLGIRIICPFSSDLEIVDNFINEQFNVDKAEYKKEELAFDKLDYTSNHYDVRINSSKIYIEDASLYKDLVFEIQVRSINQHAWSNSAHILTYKSEADIPPVLQRKVYRLLSLYEIADDEFTSVNKQLQDLKNNIAYHFIRNLEGKVYKYTKSDFDRDLSIFYFNKLLSEFGADKKEELIDLVKKHAENNDSKLKNLFDENMIRFHKIPVLTQPEIFLIFYMLDNHLSLLESIYVNELDEDELNTLKGIWV